MHGLGPVTQRIHPVDMPVLRIPVRCGKADLWERYTGMGSNVLPPSAEPPPTGVTTLQINLYF